MEKSQYYYLQLTTKGIAEKYSTRSKTKIWKQIQKTLSETSIMDEKPIMPRGFKTLRSLQHNLVPLKYDEHITLEINDTVVQITKVRNL